MIISGINVNLPAEISCAYSGFSSAAIFFMLIILLVSCAGGSSLPSELIMETHPEAYPIPNNDRNDPSNPYRYIAHAGGEYNGMTYTNSLEAMDLSASKGFKMFELDLILTGDDQIAAAHDWDMWKQISKYGKDTPPTLAEFMSLSLYDMLTPLSMTDINEWFGVHTDAILITDKITDFDKLVETFPYPERLMVEVFSLNDYILAHRKGIRYPVLSLEAAASGPDGEWLLDFIIKNKIPMAALSTASTETVRDEITAINAHGGFVFAFTSNETEYLPSHPELFAVYTDTINFTTMTVVPISNDAPRIND